MKKRILLIDKDEFVLKSFEYKLKQSGFEVFIANNGFSGIKMIKKIKPDLIFLELILPPPGGFEILKEFGSHFNFIVCSELKLEKDIQSAQKMGAKEFVKKEGIPTNTIAKLAVKYLN